MKYNWQFRRENGGLNVLASQNEAISTHTYGHLYNA